MTGMVYGVAGTTASTANYAAGVIGNETATSGAVHGVSGSTNSSSDGAAGVNGYEGATSGASFGVFGQNFSSAGAGVSGVSNASSGGTGVNGNATATTGSATGVRQDAWANAHRIPVEEEKPEQVRGTYLYPELFRSRRLRVGWEPSTCPSF